MLIKLLSMKVYNFEFYELNTVEVKIMKMFESNEEITRDLI